MGITRCLPRKGAFEIARHYVNGGKEGLHGVKAGPEVVPCGGFRPLYLARHHQYVPHYAHAGPVYLRLRQGGGGWRGEKVGVGEGVISGSAGSAAPTAQPVRSIIESAIGKSLFILSQPPPFLFRKYPLSYLRFREHRRHVRRLPRAHLHEQRAAGVQVGSIIPGYPAVKVQPVRAAVQRKHRLPLHLGLQ